MSVYDSKWNLWKNVVDFFEKDNIRIWQKVNSFLFFFAVKKVGYNIFFFLPMVTFFFHFTILYWFCHTSTWICHGCTCVSNSETPFHLPPHTISLGHPSAPAPSILYPASNLDCNSFLIWYYTCFNAILPNHPTLSLSHTVQKTLLHICVSFAVLHTGLSLPSF